MSKSTATTRYRTIDWEDPHLSMRANAGATEIVEILIGRTVQNVLMLYDPSLVSQAYPTLEMIDDGGVHRPSRYKLTREDASTLLFDLNERAVAGEFGMGSTTQERRACRHAAEGVSGAILAAWPTEDR